MRDRREFLKTSLAGGIFLLAEGASSKVHLLAEDTGKGTGSDPWAEVPEILRRIAPPAFPQRDFEISAFGAVADNRTDCTDAFRKAIAACHAAGGGRVVVLPGQYLTGAITLLSNVNLHVSRGATIRFSRETQKYPLVFTRWEGVELMNYSPFIYAFEQENIAITGSGTIDGNADCEHWWLWKDRTHCSSKEDDANQEKDRNHLFDMAERGVSVRERVFGEGHYLRPQFIEPYRCKNVLIEGVTLFNSPMWQVHPVLCTNVIVRGLTISSFGPNTDGCDPESCTDVLIEKCFFNTGDDCIAIKSGRNTDGRRVNVPSQNIIIRDCLMKDGHGGVTVGSEISGGVNHVFAENCQMGISHMEKDGGVAAGSEASGGTHHVFAEDCQMDCSHLDVAVRIKNNATRGGVLEHIYARNIEVGQVGMAGFSVDFNYEEGAQGKFTPVARNMEIRNMKVRKAKYGLYLRGLKDAPIENIRVSGCDFDSVQKPDVVENVVNLSLKDVKEDGRLVNHQ